MDRDLILAKIESLTRSIRRIEAKTPKNPDLLKEDYDLQDIISVNLERAVQLCVDIAAHVIADSDEKAPSSMADSFDILHRLGIIPETLSGRLKKAVGFRNVAVHEYEKIDWEIVYRIITERLDDFRLLARKVLERTSL
jgi:uncharacterized protein YutE (UPF0331/DUF86 family)